MSKLIYDRIQAVRKDAHQFQKEPLAPIPNGVQSMPRLELSKTTLNPRSQLRDSGNDPDKENKNVANILERKQKNTKSDYVNIMKESTTFSLQNPTSRDSHKERPRLSNELKNPCSSPHFNGGWTNPSTSRNIQAELKRNSMHERLNLDEKAGFKKDEVLGSRQSKDRYKQMNVDNLPLNQTSGERPFEGLNLRRSMSLEDLRKGRKAFEVEQSRNLYQDEPRDYTFSFNTRRPMVGGKPMQGNIFHDSMHNRDVKGHFETNLDSYINYFDRNQEMSSRNSRSSVKGEYTETDYIENCKTHVRQLKVAYAEIGFLKEQVERLKHKKSSLVSANNMLIREVSHNQLKEKTFKEKSQLMQAQVICLRQEVKHYRNKLKEAHLIIQEERISNQNHLIFLKEILSNNISLALEHKLKHHLSSEKEREYKHRHSLKHLLGGNHTYNERSRRPDPQQYLYSFDERAGDPNLGRYRKQHRRVLEPHVMLKDGLSPWVSLHNISQDVNEEEEEEITEQSEQNNLVEVENWKEESPEENEEEGKQEEEVQNEQEEEQEGENEEEVEIEKAEQVYVPGSTASKKDKQIKWLQKKLGELLKGDRIAYGQHYAKDKAHSHHSKFRPGAANNLDYHQRNSYIRYDEADRRQSHTFGRALKHDDINNYSFSLHNSEEC